MGRGTFLSETENQEGNTKSGKLKCQIVEAKQTIKATIEKMRAAKNQKQNITRLKKNRFWSVRFEPRNLCRPRHIRCLQDKLTMSA